VIAKGLAGYPALAVVQPRERPGDSRPPRRDQLGRTIHHFSQNSQRALPLPTRFHVEVGRGFQFGD
jgi:hypothetical protein